MNPTPIPRLHALLPAVFAAALAAPAGAAEFELGADTWARPRTADSVRRMEPVGGAARAWMSDPAQVLELQYPGGETGMLWAEELRDWLVSLGVPLDRIQTLAGSAAADRLLIRVRPEDPS